MDHKTINPFLSVWLHPKQTARYMLDHKTQGFAMMIIVICTIISLPANLMDSGELLSWPALIAVIILSPLLAILALYITAFFPWAFGKLFKGTSSYTDMVKVSCLASIPVSLIGPAYLIWFVVSPDTLLNPDLIQTGPELTLLISVVLLTIILFIWSTAVTICVVAVAHNYSNWKAFFTLLIPAAILFIFVMALVFVITLFLISI